MPATVVRVFRNARGGIPLKEWLDSLESDEPVAYARCLERILELADLGYELRRPHADTLRDGIHELRAKSGTVQYRILYFFHGKNVAILSHGITKEDSIPPKEIDKAIDHKKLIKKDPERYTADFEN